MDQLQQLMDAPIVAWCIESTDSADWCWFATRDGVIENARFLDEGCTPGEPFAVVRQSDHQAQVSALLARLDAAEAELAALRAGGGVPDVRHADELPGMWHTSDLVGGEADTVQVYGVKGGKETLLGTAPMPPRMKARDLAREQFGHFEDEDGSDADMCFAALETLIDWMIAQGWKCTALSTAPTAPQVGPSDTELLDWAQASQESLYRFIEVERVPLTTGPGYEIRNVFKGWVIGMRDDPKLAIRDAIRAAMGHPTSEGG